MQNQSNRQRIIGLGILFFATLLTFAALIPLLRGIGTGIHLVSMLVGLVTAALLVAGKNRHEHLACAAMGMSVLGTTLGVVGIIAHLQTGVALMVPLVFTIAVLAAAFLLWRYRRLKSTTQITAPPMEPIQV